MKISFRFINIHPSPPPRIISRDTLSLFFHANEIQLIKLSPLPVPRKFHSNRHFSFVLLVLFHYMGEGNGAKNTLSVESKRKKKRKWKERRAYCCEIQSCTRGSGLITKQFTRRTRVLLTRVSLCTWMRSPKCGIVCCRKQPPPLLQGSAKSWRAENL